MSRNPAVDLCDAGGGRNMSLLNRNHRKVRESSSIAPRVARQYGIFELLADQPLLRAPEHFQRTATQAQPIDRGRDQRAACRRNALKTSSSMSEGLRTFTCRTYWPLPSRRPRGSLSVEPCKKPNWTWSGAEYT